MSAAQMTDDQRESEEEIRRMASDVAEEHTVWICVG